MKTLNISPLKKSFNSNWKKAFYYFGLIFLFAACGGESDNENNNSNEQLRSITATDSVRSVSLPDGSSVLLNRGSTMSYPEEFDGEERKVNLKGEAYFEVAKNSKKKFKVYAGNTKTTVIGTIFNIKTDGETDGIEVTVLEGEVEVEDRETKEQVRLTRAEQIVHKRKQKMQKRQVRLNKMKLWFNNFPNRLKKMKNGLNNLKNKFKKKD